MRENRTKRGAAVSTGLLVLLVLFGSLSEATAQDSGASISEEPQFQQKVDGFFQELNDRLVPILFFDISFEMFKVPAQDDNGQALHGVLVGPEIPLIVLVLVLGGVFFSIRYGFISVRLFGHSIRVIRGKYDNPKDQGEITHFQALTSALSATVGLGNIAGVAVAISMGGPGAVFWMWVTAIIGMNTKFSSCSLAQIYRRVEVEDGRTGREHVLGGPMVYLAEGVKQQLGGGIGAAALGKTLAVLFAIFAILGSICGGNMFQGNQMFELVSEVALGGSREYAWVGGLVIAALVGVVVVGGIKRIGEVTAKLVPAMCVFYCGVCLIIVLANVEKVPAMFGGIFKGAFTADAAVWGGIVGVFVIGVKRAAFSNEAGLGSAAIVHAAARTSEPIRAGVVAMIGPFIDTIIVCTMTALAILITDAHIADSGEQISNKGVAITAAAFASLAPWLKYLLTIAVFTFAYSTMISWCYYGERATEYLCGKRGIWPFRVIFLIFVVLGPIVSLSNVITFTDLLILSMAYPNIIGMIILSPKVAAMTKDYVRRLKSGQMKTYAELQQERDDQPSI